MIPTAPIVMVAAVFLRSGDPVMDGQMIGIPVILIALAFVAICFRNDLNKQVMAAAVFGLLNGVAARIVFFIAHGLSI